MPTGIEWTDETWNPIRGCSRVSRGCENCYAEAIAARFSGEGQPYHGLARRRSNGEPAWTGMVRVVEEHMNDPLRWRRPRRVFVNSMSDLFHESIPDSTIARIFAVMARAHRHTFQVLTKRAARMQSWVAEGGKDLTLFMLEADEPRWPLSNVWLGTSVENQQAADDRIPDLIATPAAVRFLSCEPLLDSIDLTRIDDDEFIVNALDGTRLLLGGGGSEPNPWGDRVHWVIAGGESGPHARPCDVQWLWSIVEQCQLAGVPVFVKQLGAASNVPWEIGSRKGGDPEEWPTELRVRDFPREVATV